MKIKVSPRCFIPQKQLGFCSEYLSARRYLLNPTCPEYQQLLQFGIADGQGQYQCGICRLNLQVGTYSHKILLPTMIKLSLIPMRLVEKRV